MILSVVSRVAVFRVLRTHGYVIYVVDDCFGGFEAPCERGHTLESYSMDQLVVEFEKLTGEDIGDIFVLAGLDQTLEKVQLVLHCTIMQANESGVIRGQPLQSMSGERQGGVLPSTSAGKT